MSAADILKILAFMKDLSDEDRKKLITENIPQRWCIHCGDSHPLEFNCQ